VKNRELERLIAEVQHRQGEFNDVEVDRTMNPHELLKVVAAESEDVSLTAVFHRLNSVLPDNQRMVTVPPETKTSEALQVMRQHGFSQLPVIVGDEVLGLFSYRSFAHAVLALASESGNRSGSSASSRPRWVRRCSRSCSGLTGR